MSRSVKKNPAGGITAASSDKDDKVRAHRKTRRVSRLALRNGADALPDRRQTENPWTYSKDGKAWFRRKLPELMRK